MEEEKKTAEFYKNLENQLAEYTTWPADYLYKFIVPASNKKIAQIEEIFDNMNAEIRTKDSSKGKYTSISIHIKMESPEMVISKYKEVGEKVEGVISLSIQIKS